MSLGVVVFFSLVFFFFDYVILLWSLGLFFFLVFNSYYFFFDGFFLSDSFVFVLVFMSFLVYYFALFSMDLGFLGVFFLWSMSIFCGFSFMVINFLFFYMSFELVFIMMFIYLLGWGLTMERLKASFYMFFYTMVFSFPFFVMLVDLSYWGSGLFSFLGFFHYSDFLWVFMLMVFAVKLPLFGVHLWLPKAHVEAPVAGSMILAGVLLKLGGYGIFRFLYLMWCEGFHSSGFLTFLFYVSVFGSVVVSLYCLRSSDIKGIIAYSSVVHMGSFMMGILCFKFFALWGSFLMMFSHGLVSSFIFFCMSFLYDLTYSRSLVILKGGCLLSSFFVFFWFLGCFMNLGLPPFMSFFSEVLIVGSLSSFSFFEAVFVFLILFFVGLYCVYLFTTVCHGVSLFMVSYYFNFKFVLLSLLHCFYILFFFLISFIS